MKNLYIGAIFILSVGLIIQGYFYISSKKELAKIAIEKAGEAREKKFGDCVSAKVNDKSLSPQTLLECYRDSLK